jgi:hypothetical protein
VILANCTNILSIVSSHVYFPTTSNSLKEIAGFLRFRWSSVGASGLESIVWREQWEEVPDEVLKSKLLEYNLDDCLALRTVTEFIASITTSEIKDRSEQSNLAEIVYTRDLQSDVSGITCYSANSFLSFDLRPSRSAFARIRSAVPKPSVNWSWIDCNSLRPSSSRPWACQT